MCVLDACLRTCVGASAVLIERVDLMTNVCTEEKLMVFQPKVNGCVTHRNGPVKWKWPQSILGHRCPRIRCQKKRDTSVDATILTWFIFTHFSYP